MPTVTEVAGRDHPRSEGVGHADIVLFSEVCGAREALFLTVEPSGRRSTVLRITGAPVEAMTIPSWAVKANAIVATLDDAEAVATGADADLTRVDHPGGESVR